MEIQGITLGAVVLILLKELVGLFSGAHKKNTSALESATHAIIKLETKLEYITKYLEKIPQLEEDIHVAHSKLRELKTKIDGSLS